MPHEGHADPIMNDGPEFHSNISGRSHRGSFINLHFTFLVHEHSFIHSHASKHRICNYCITTLRVVSQSGSHLIRYERRLTEVRRPTHKGLEAALRQTEPREKT